MGFFYFIICKVCSGEKLIISPESTRKKIIFPKRFH